MCSSRALIGTMPLWSDIVSRNAALAWRALRGDLRPGARAQAVVSSLLIVVFDFFKLGVDYIFGLSLGGLTFGAACSLLGVGFFR